ncbi:MAG: PEP-CTERM sorting domain-containing protein [Hylemonella sp.]|nr:PEP-CTERM sorting domain-containing protein [Hylemonella sp.]
MNFTKTMFALAIGSVGIMGAMSAHAAVVAGDTLTIDAGVPVTSTTGTGSPSSPFVTTQTNVNPGSWFGMDTNGSNSITGTEKTALTGAAGSVITIGQISTAGAYGAGLGAVGTVGPMFDSWGFFGATGTNFTTVGITAVAGGLDFSGIHVAWNNVPSIDMGGNAWGAGFTSGVANFTWSGVYGTAYTLDYHAAVPSTSPAFPEVKYALHLTGIVNAAPVPEASTYGMMLAGLGLVGFAVRRRKSAI